MTTAMDMPTTELSQQLESIRKVMRNTLRRSPVEALADDLRPCLDGGQMLRSRLTLRVGAGAGTPERLLIPRAAAVELLHAASLLHDDLLDGGVVRRGEPSLWVQRGVKTAVLAGDMLVARAMRLVQEHATALMPVALEILQDMCDAETEQEICLLGEDRSWDTCVDNARRRTGGLFGLAACAGACDDAALIPVLREAGTRAGTAYQLADDILDAYHKPGASGKTLGTDARSGRLTAVTAACRPDQDLMSWVWGLLDSSREALGDRPREREAWECYLAKDIGPAIERLTSCYQSEVAIV